VPFRILDWLVENNNLPLPKAISLAVSEKARVSVIWVSDSAGRVKQLNMSHEAYEALYRTNNPGINQDERGLAIAHVH
jgi:hypothetical protein